MKILFIVPRCSGSKQTYREYPLGVGIVGTILKQYGHTVAILDEQVENIDDNGFLSKLSSFKPDVIGFSVLTSSYPSARKLMRLARGNTEKISVVAGGVHASLFPEDLLEDGADVVVAGEGERTMLQLIERWRAGRDLGDVEGVSYVDGGTVVRRAPGRQKVDINKLPPVDRSLYSLSEYTHHSMSCSRGCPYKCNFCFNYSATMLNNGTSVRSTSSVIDEMVHVRDVYDARQVFFVDDNFFLRKKSAKEFCRSMIERRVGVSWIAQIRVDQFDKELASLMVEAGCERVYFGVEAGSDEILKATRKGITSRQIREGLLTAKQAGLRVKTGWIYGLPGRLEDQYESVKLMTELRPHEISVHQLIPFPGTSYYHHASRYGIRIKDPKRFETFCFSGLQSNFTFDYLSHSDLMDLYEYTIRTLSREGYVSSDEKSSGSEYFYTTPLNSTSMDVFRADGEGSD